MIKAIIFDFDGVILESADIKTEAFRELFSAYPKEVERIVNYHLVNSGISRFVKFRYIYENFLNQRLKDKEEIELGERFSEIVFQNVLVAPFVAGAKEFLELNKNKYQLFIVSGTPQEELNNIVSARDLKKYFKSIQGSPKIKTKAINDILSRHGFSKKEAVYVGDAESDEIAACESEIVFIRRRIASDKELYNNSFVINDLFSLDRILKEEIR